jgi:hypothetical protein
VQFEKPGPILRRAISGHSLCPDGNCFHPGSLVTFESNELIPQQLNLGVLEGRARLKLVITYTSLPGKQLTLKHPGMKLTRSALFTATSKLP